MHDPAHDDTAIRNRRLKALAIAQYCWRHGPDPAAVTGRGARLKVERDAGLVRSSKSSDETWGLAIALFDRHRDQYGPPVWMQRTERRTGP